MKKLLAIILAVFVLCTCASLGALAESVPHELEDECYVKGDFESIDFSGKTYVMFDEKDADIVGDDYVDIYEKYLDEKIEDKYDYVDIFYYSEYPYILHVEIQNDNNKWITRYFVEKSRYDAVCAVANGEGESSYITVSNYDTEKSLSIEQIFNWVNTSEKLQQPANTLSYEDAYPLYATDSGGAVRKEIGLMLRDVNNEFYLVYYPEYERNYFYADGRFAIDSDEMATFYVLGNTKIGDELYEFYNTVPEFEDDLEWMVNDKMPAPVFFVITLIIFILAPLAAIVFAVILLRKPKTRDTYKLSLIALCISAALIIIGYTVFVLLIL